MSDTAYPVFEHYGTNAARLAFTPAPASGTQPIYVWYETDTNLVYIYTTAWKGPYVYLPSGYTTGDLLLGSGSNAVSRLAIGTNTYVLTSNGTTAAWAAPGAGGSGAWALISKQTLASAAATVTFSSISGSYNNLCVIYQARLTDATSSNGLGMRFNADTGTNYDRAYIYMLGTSVSGNNNPGLTSMYIAPIPISGSTTGAAGSGQIWIPNYAGTTFHKVANSFFGAFFTEGTGSTYRAGAFMHNWRSTSAITSITFLDVDGGNIDTGSTFCLYGIT